MLLIYKTLLPLTGTRGAVGTEVPREQGRAWFCLLQLLPAEQLHPRCARLNAQQAIVSLLPTEARTKSSSK